LGIGKRLTAEFLHVGVREKILGNPRLYRNPGRRKTEGDKMGQAEQSGKPAACKLANAIPGGAGMVAWRITSFRSAW
jgi:hypothetical protein